MKRSLLLLIVIVVALCGFCIGQSCSIYNWTSPNYPKANTDYKEHFTGYHGWKENFSGTCVYSNPSAGSNCHIHATANSAVLEQDEFGTIKTFYTHYYSYNAKNGAGDSNGPAITVDTDGAFAVKSCLVSCDVSIGFTGSGNGLGITANFPANSLWTDEQYYKNICDEYGVPVGNRNCDPNANPPDPNCSTPLIVDTRGTGFHFTNPKKTCVLYDLAGNGNPRCYSWPKEGSGNAWLVLTNPDGTVSLFGNYTAHANGDYLPVADRPHPPQGFTALMYYDQTEQGGNQDLVIDNQDAIWPRLKLWIDDHCAEEPRMICTARLSELHDPGEFGIARFGVVYSSPEKHQYDQWGNWFRFYSQGNPRHGALQFPENEARELRVYDVYLAQQ